MNIIKGALFLPAIPFTVMLYTDKTRLGNFTHRNYAALGKKSNANIWIRKN